MRGKYFYILACAVCLLCPATQSEASKKIMVHYMPWYQTLDISGYWGWHWTMNFFDPNTMDGQGKRDIASHYYPTIGPYDSSDPDALEYHALLMKLAGVDGVIVDWYGSTDHYDYGTLRDSTEDLFEVIRKAGLRFAICYEDRTIDKMVNEAVIPASNAIAQARLDMLYLETNFFGDAAYLQMDNQPVLLNFADVYFDQTWQWNAIFDAMSNYPTFFTLHDRLAPAAGAFGWPPMHLSGGGTLSPSQLNTYLNDFAQDAGGWSRSVSAAMPAFHDIYQQAGVGSSYGYLDAQNGHTLSNTLMRAITNLTDIVQITTWNDFGEGTIVEPTCEFGFRYLETIQNLRRQYLDPSFSYTTNELDLPQRLHALRKEYPSNTLVNAELDRIFYDIISNRVTLARDKITAIESLDVFMYNPALENGIFSSSICSPLATNVVIFCATNLLNPNWLEVDSMEPTTNAMVFTNNVLGDVASSYYRAQGMGIPIEPPVAIGSASSYSGPAPLFISFDGSASTDDGTIESYTWNPGDGSPDSVGALYDHTYLQTGVYAAVLTVVDNHGLSDSSTQVVTVVDAGVADNSADMSLNLAVISSASNTGSILSGGRGAPQDILFDPYAGDYFVQTDWNQYGVAFSSNLGTVAESNAFFWQTAWPTAKLINYITIGGPYTNQPQPNTMWKVQYRLSGSWSTLAAGQGGWIDGGIFQWGGIHTQPIVADAVRAIAYSDGINDLVSIHLRGRGGVSLNVDDHTTTPKATVIQYLGYDSNGCQMATFSSSNVLSFGDDAVPPQDEDVTAFDAEDGGTALHLYSNTWKAIYFPYTITPNTMLEFDFISDGSQQPEISAIGMETQIDINNNDKLFQFYGSQSIGAMIQDYSYTIPGSTQHMTIAIGEHYTGTKSYLVLVHDNDGHADASVRFSNVKVYEKSLDQAGLQWKPLEWSFVNSSFSGNAYDLVADVTIDHDHSSEQFITQMFYDENDTWKFRFTANKTGTWSFSTSSADSDLNGKTGVVTIAANSNGVGFLTSQGNKYSRPEGIDGTPKGFIMNVYQDGTRNPSYLHNYDATETQLYIDDVNTFGMNAMTFIVNNGWFKFGVNEHDGHSSVNPDPATFELVEQVITTARVQGVHVHIWIWGDEDRKWTPIGVGGINGTPDKRLQRYMAARLGPLPGWSAGYGFDLQEWVTEAQLEEWSSYMRGFMGWDHLLGGRGFKTNSLNLNSYSGTAPIFGPTNYQEVVIDLSSDTNRPHLYAERFFYQRWGEYDMDATRQQRWWNAMAGGMGAWWGVGFSDPTQYPNPEQLRTHRDFWNDRFLLDFQPTNSLTDGYALKDAASENYVFYKENTQTIQMDLSGMSGTQQAYAVDTKLSYAEIDLGLFGPSNVTWTAAYTSDWAIAVGDFAP